MPGEDPALRAVARGPRRPRRRDRLGAELQDQSWRWERIGGDQIEVIDEYDAVAIAAIAIAIPAIAAPAAAAIAATDNATFAASATAAATDTASITTAAATASATAAATAARPRPEPELAAGLGDDRITGPRGEREHRVARGGEADRQRAGDDHAVGLRGDRGGRARDRVRIGGEPRRRAHPLAAQRGGGARERSLGVGRRRGRLERLAQRQLEVHGPGVRAARQR